MTRFTILAFTMILGAALSRLIPHPPNVTPIAAMALVGGAYLDKRFAFAVPLAAMVVSDWFIGFHSLIPFVYGSFLLTGLIGLWLRSRRRLLPLMGGAVASSILFYLVTNAGVWYSSSFYPKNMEGLVECYVAALPFFRNALIGDLLYTGALVCVLEIAARWAQRSQMAIEG